jgi:TRAP-type uncharacterized transport system substrate-binding protein
MERDMRLTTRGLTAALVLMLAPALGAQEIKIAASSSSGTYQKMLGELIGVCSTDAFPITMAQNEGGAPGNLDALVNNRAQAAFLHSDVYFANAQADPTYKRYKTLLALWPEPIHVLALRTSKTGRKGFSLGKQEFTSLQDAKGFRVGAAGGGVFTSRILTGQGEGGFEVVPFNTGAEVIDALNKGDIALAIFVGAAPLPNLEKLDHTAYKLIPVGETIAARVKGVYREVNINYAGMTDGPLKTLAPLATLLTRQYQTEARIAAQRHLRQCFYQKLPQLQDEGSPNWQQVSASDRGVLDWLDLPK